MFSGLAPRARIPDTRIPQLMQPWTTVCLALSMKNKSFISLMSNNNHTSTMTLAWNERNQDFWPKIVALVSNLLSKHLFVVLIVWDKSVLVLIFTLFTNLFKDHSPDSFKDTMVGESTLEKISNSSFKMELVRTTTSFRGSNYIFWVATRRQDTIFLATVPNPCFPISSKFLRNKFYETLVCEGLFKTLTKMGIFEQWMHKTLKFSSVCCQA